MENEWLTADCHTIAVGGAEMKRGGSNYKHS
jgi:hypothetical protein